MGNAILALAGRVSASIIGQCAAADLPLNCETAFTDGTNTSVASFGNVTFGSFEADPDIAGIGTISSFVASTALFLFIALSIVLSRIICLGGDIAKTDPSRPAFASLPIPRPRPEEYRTGWIENRIIDPVINRFSEFWASRSHSRGEYTQAYSDNAHLSRQQPEMDHDTIQIQPYPYPPKFTSSVSEPHYNTLDKRGDALSASEPANMTPDRDGDTEFALGALTSYEKKILEKSYDIYDILEAALFCISDNQILLSLAFSISFFVKGTAKCILSQYHLKIALNLWLGSAINGVLTFSVVRRYFESPLAGLLRFLALGVSLVLSLGGPLLLELNSGFASEAVPSKDRHNSQIFLNALCFMDPSFRHDVVADQINNHAVIGESTTNPEASQDFASWISILVIGGLVVIGRFLHRVIRITRRGHYIEDENNRNKIDLYYWIFLSLVWLFAATSFSYRTWLIFHIRRWVEQSGWLSDQLAEYRLDTFGQFASVMFMVAIAQAMADELVPKERKE